MLILPAIDLYEGKVVRLYKGDYNAMTIYSTEPSTVAASFEDMGAEYLHVVDLEGARAGGTPNLPSIQRIREACKLSIEVGGGIRSMEVIQKYIDAGVNRVILGTAAVTDGTLVRDAVKRYGEAVAVGADVRDGCIAINGWLESSTLTLEAFLDSMTSIGVSTVICTDISRDGAMRGANIALYRQICAKYPMRLIASGGVTTLGDIDALRDSGIYGAIVGKAYYTGDIDLVRAIEVANAG